MPLPLIPVILTVGSMAISAILAVGSTAEKVDEAADPINRVMQNAAGLIMLGIGAYVFYTIAVKKKGGI